MKKTSIISAVVAAGALTAAAMGPVMADSTQKNKNMWRNLGIAGGVVAAHGLITHNSTETLLGAAGGAYSASRYEQERRSQSRRNSWRNYHRRHYYRY